MGKSNRGDAIDVARSIDGQVDWVDEAEAEEIRKWEQLDAHH